MAISLSVLKYSPAVNPDRVFLKVAFSGNYVTGGDTLNLTPDSWTDPNGLGLIGEPSAPPTVAPGVFSASLDGAYAQVVPGTTLATYKLQCFEAGGTEVPAGAYPAGFTGGSAVLEVVF